MQHDFTNAPEVREANELVERAVAAAGTYKITTPVEYTDSAGMLKKIKASQARLEALRTAITGPLNTALKAANDLFRAPAARLVDAETTIKREIGRYQQELEAQRREEQRKADEAAARERAKREAEQRKAEEEAAEKRRQAEAARTSGDLAAAARLEQAAERREEKAEAASMAAATVVAPIIQREAPKVTGIVMRQAWKAECTDLMALVKAISEGRAPLSLVTPNDKVIGAQARSLKQDFKADGIRVWSEDQVAAGAA